jgi:hypothetical protein
VTAFVGFDGYVDLIQKAVKSNEKGEKIFYNYLVEIGTHISAAAGKSAQIELATILKKIRRQCTYHG